MPASALLLANGGPIQFWALKLLLVVAIGAALLLATRWLRRDVPGAARLYRLVLLATQVGTVIAAIVSLQNAMLATSL
jgi:MFS superfamily sulfate permease-like transporter